MPLSIISKVRLVYTYNSHAYDEPEQSASYHAGFASTVSVTTQVPFLVLEELDHVLRSVTCEPGIIHLAFFHEEAFATVARHAMNSNGSMLVSLHPECGLPGERAVYK